MKNDNKNYNRLPISQLIFYLTTPFLNKETKLEIESIIRKRLSRGFKLYNDEIEEIIETEEEKVRLKGRNMANYLFGRDCSLEGFFTFYHQNKDYLEKLMLTELYMLLIVFNSLALQYECRQSRITQELKRQEDNKGKIIKDRNIDLETKKTKISEIDSEVEKLEEKKQKEEIIHSYFYDVWIKLNDEMAEQLNRSATDGKRSDQIKYDLAIIAEASYCARNVKNFCDDIRYRYRNISDDVYAKDVALLQQSGSTCDFTAKKPRHIRSILLSFEQKK